MRLIALLVPLAAFHLALACSSARSSPNGAALTPDAGSGDDAASTTGDGASAAADAAPSFTPAPHAPLPQVVRATPGGKVIAHPKIVPVTFPGDPLRADIDTFVGAFATTSYWADMTAEYGVAKPVPLAPVHVAEPVAATIDDTAISAWVTGRLDGTHPEWPAPDGDTLYVLFYPPGTSVTLQGSTSCQTFHGYHFSTQVGATDVAYAVVSRCASIPEAPVTGIDYVSAVASHEVIEALTDPHPYTTPAYSDPDDAHWAWWLITGAELGDMCALVGDAFFTPKDFPYAVQRIWSNAAAKAGHDPCVPQGSDTPYIQAVPTLTDNVSFTVQGQPGTTKGVTILVGMTKTIDVALFSDAPTTGPWTVTALEPRQGASLALSLDKGKGSNGDVLKLTIKVLAQNPTYGSSPFVLESTLGTQKNLWFGLVGYGQ